MVIVCPHCRRRISLPGAVDAVRDWECPVCNARFRTSGSDVTLYGQWRVSETSGLWRAVCPFCEQHYSATPKPSPEPIDCTYCGKHFLIPARSEAENQAAAPPPEAGGTVVPNGEWCVSSVSGQLRVICPFCEQHYDAKPPKSPIVVTCTACKRQFRIPVRSDTVIPSATPMAARVFAEPEPPAAPPEVRQEEETLPRGRWCISASTGMLRAVCPFCSQHFEATPLPTPIAADCTFCRKRFIVPVYSDDGKLRIEACPPLDEPKPAQSAAPEKPGGPQN